MRWGIRVIMALVAALAGTTLAFDSSNVINNSDNLWHPSKNQVVAAIIALAISSMYSIVDGLVERRRARRRNDIAVIVAEYLFPLWSSISRRLTSAAARDALGVHAWIVPNWYARAGLPFIRSAIPECVRKRLWTPPLWRAAQYRLNHQARSTGIEWRRDVGAIGACWRAADTYYLDLTAKWGATPKTYAEWSALPKRDQMRLSFQQYQKAYTKYGQVLAVPIFRPGNTGAPQFLGCITVDLPPNMSGTNLNGPEVRSLMFPVARNVELAIDGKI